jgi:hypothetical protein
MPDEILNVASNVSETPTETPVIEPEKNWLLSMPEELQNNETLNNYKTIEDLARGHIETKRMVGDRVKIPDENATQEERDKFYARMGRPETPDAYELPKNELPVDDNAVNAFKKKAFEQGLSKKQTEAIYSDYIENIKGISAKALAEYETSVNQQVEVLKSRWGNDFEKNKELAVRAFDHYASPTLKATVEREGWGNHPDFVELFHNIGVATSEDVLRSAGSPDYRGIDDKIKSINAELFNMPEGTPGRAEKIKQRDALYKERYPESE